MARKVRPTRRVPRGPEIAKLRAEEARCSAQALGIQPPILLGFPDGALGNYNADPAMLFRLTQRLHEELQRLRPDVLITWGPDGGYGHPDHRIVSSIVSQLVRAGAPGVPQRVFYASIPAEGIRAMNPTRGVPPLRDTASQPVHHARAVHGGRFRSRAPVDGSATRRRSPRKPSNGSSQAMRDVWKGELPLSPMVPQAAGSDLFQ